MPRFPPALIALVVAVVVVGAAIGASVLFSGSTKPKGVPACTPAVEAGAYGCVAFVSTSGTEAGVSQDWLADGALTFVLLRDTGSGGQQRITYTGGCTHTTAPVLVTSKRIKVTGTGATTLQACSAARMQHDEWAARLFTGTAQAAEQSDATFVVTNGTRHVVFAEVIAPKP